MEHESPHPVVPLTCFMVSVVLSGRWPPAGCRLSRGNVPSLKEGLSPSLLLRAAGRNQPVAAGKKCSMILLQAVVSLAFSVLQGVRLCCSEPQVLCSPSGSTSVHLEVRLGPAEPCKVSWGGRANRRLSGMLVEMEKLFLELWCPAGSTVCKGFT